MLLSCLLAACGDNGPRALRAECAAPEGTEAFAFQVGDHQLAGFVDAPAAPGRHPAVLLVGGRHPTDVTRGEGDYARLRAALRAAGIASVAWDRAGTGCSGGDYGGIADLYARADEVLAAAAALATRTDIDPARIGAWALGEGGWVATMAATRSQDLAFLVVVGAPARDPVSQRLYLARKNLELEAGEGTDVEALVGEYARALDLLKGLAPYEDFRRVAEPLARQPFFARLEALGYEVYPREARYRALQGSAAFEVDARLFLPAIDIPVLAVFGDHDVQVDWRESVRVYRASFEGRGGGDLTVRVLEDADHHLCAPARGRLEARLAPELCRYVEGYPELVIEWLRSRGLTGS